MAVIEIDNVSKWYDEVLGVSEIHTRIEPGVTGLLGANGAGKSTLLKLLTGQIKPSAGTIRISGEPVWNNNSIYAKIGFCPDTESLYDYMTGFQFLCYIARLNGQSKQNAQKTAERGLERVGLTEAANKRIGAYSKGMRQRVKYAQSILHDPEYLFLDEPLSGMDPIGRNALVELIREFGRQEKIVLVSSHILHEVQEMTNRVLVLNNGMLLAEGTVQEIRELIDEQPRHIQILTPDRQTLSNRLVTYPEVQTLSFGEEENELIVQITSPDDFYNRLDSLVLDEGIKIQQLVATDDNLESIFEYLVK